MKFVTFIEFLTGKLSNSTPLQQILSIRKYKSFSALFLGRLNYSGVRSLAVNDKNVYI